MHSLSLRYNSKVQENTQPLSKLITNLMESDLKEKVQSITPILGGDESTTFSVVTNRAMRIVKLQPESEYHRFLKEQWCTEQVAEIGMPEPSVLSMGRKKGYAYIILSFIAGSPPNDSEEEKGRIWNILGAYGKRIHAVPVSNFGHNMYQKGVFDGSWLKFLEYNIRSLSETDKLIQLNVINSQQSERVRRKFVELKNIPFDIGLCHGDLSLLNVLVDRDGTVYLYDWGQAEANIVPYFDVIGILENHPNSRKELELFLKGYGMNESELPHLNVLWLLKRIDKLRWAIDRSPKDISDFASQVQARLRLIETNS